MRIYTIQNSEYGIVKTNEKNLVADDILFIVTTIFNTPDAYKLSNDVLWFVLYEKNEIAGIVSAKWLSKYTIWMSELGILKKYRRQGLGTLLVKHIQNIATINNMDLLLDSENTEDLKKFYISFNSKILKSNNKNILWNLSKFS